MKINNIRRILYKISRVLGDVNAVKRGTVGKRVGRRAAGRQTGKLLRKLFK
ncbi:hypothetical protein [Salibacterium salarium]|uniref:hypothetical protein n=1 Tax=Salibacterium salarium TaxID=284579 RepID=UPI00163A78AF|nr:hypothetical protein [Salibacterium salarium]